MQIVENNDFLNYLHFTFFLGHPVYFFSFSPKVDFLGSVVTGTGSYVLHILIAQLWADV